MDIDTNEVINLMTSTSYNMEQQSEDKAISNDDIIELITLTLKRIYKIDRNVHNYNHDSELKKLVYTSIKKNNKELKLMEDHYDNIYNEHIELIFRSSGLIKRSYNQLSESFDTAIYDTSGNIIEDIENDREHHYGPIIKKLKMVKDIPQKSDEWYLFRKKHITGSNAWKVFKSDATRRQLTYEKLIPDEMAIIKGTLNENSPLNWGHRFEPLTTWLYEYYNDVQVDEFGCIPHDSIEFLAASPDGIVVSGNKYGRMLEIKNVVTREITGIPKMEYYIQMQIQMEVCNLPDCDFVETKFVEYDDSDEFYKDKYRLEKGCIMIFVKNNSQLVYEYSALFNNRKTVIDKFIDDTMTKYEEMCSSEETTDSYMWYRNIYWKLDKYSCTYVPRNSKWFENVYDDMVIFWNKVEEEQEIPDSYLKYKATSKASTKKKHIQHITL